MKLTAENTAIVLDSTADLPDAADRFPNWRVVPLYVRFGDESLRDGVDISAAEFYERLRSSSVFPTTSQPTPGDFLACYEELGAYERILSLHLSARVSGTFASAEAAAAEVGRRVVRAIDTETASASIAMLALAIQRRLERGTSDEEIEALVERYRGERGLLFTVDTLEFLQRGGRIGKARRVRRDAAAGQADPLDPRRRGRAGEACPRGPEGVRRARAGARDGDEGRAGVTGWASHTPRPRSGRPSSRLSSDSSVRGPSWSWSSPSVPSSARTPARVRSRSSGSVMTPDDPAPSPRDQPQSDPLRIVLSAVLTAVLGVAVAAAFLHYYPRASDEGPTAAALGDAFTWILGACVGLLIGSGATALFVRHGSRFFAGMLAGAAGFWVGVMPYMVLTAPSDVSFLRRLRLRGHRLRAGDPLRRGRRCHRRRPPSPAFATLTSGPSGILPSARCRGR